uniref:Elongation factor 1-beta n=1 Tax=Takifugu rubripes TaxID=31033 RepID=A0A674P223_TAKRU
MGFGDLKSASGLKVLNDFLSYRSYIEGYVPSQADTVVFDAISSPPPADLVHALRWYNHIKSFQKGSLPGVKKPLGQYGPPGVADTTSASKPAAKKDDDDDIDLFGSDEEEDEETARIKEERLAQYAKLQIGCVVEDDKVGTEILEEQITAFEDYVQSMDVAAFNKI